MFFIKLVKSSNLFGIFYQIFENSQFMKLFREENPPPFMCKQVFLKVGTPSALLLAYRHKALKRRKETIMNVFKRIADIFNSNVNSVLDRIEDPAKMINLMITELQDTHTKARSSAAARKAEKASLITEKNELTKAIERWEERARLAVTNKREDLAREALSEKKSCIERIRLIDEQLLNLESILTSQEVQLTQIADKLKEVKDKQKILVQRATSAKEKKQVARTLQSSDSTDLARKFSELESKIERMEADAEMASYHGKSSTSDEFNKMENDSAIEEELEKLKASMKEKK
jgi:phage shock protein A